MALKKREILKRVIEEIEPGKWNVAKPQDSEDPDTECILQRKADRKEVKLAIGNSRFRSNNTDEIKKLVESAINFPYLRRAAGAPGAAHRRLRSDSSRGGGIAAVAIAWEIGAMDPDDPRRIELIDEMSALTLISAEMKSKS